jgi:hypothetical protein
LLSDLECCSDIAYHCSSCRCLYCRFRAASGTKLQKKKIKVRPEKKVLLYIMELMKMVEDVFYVIYVNEYSRVMEF